MKDPWPQNRSYSTKSRSNTTPLVFAAILIVLMVTTCLVATRDRRGYDVPPATPTPMQQLR